MQASGLEHYSFLRRWAGIPNLHETTRNEDNASEERLGGYQKLGKCEQTDLRTFEKYTFTLYKKTEQSSFEKWIRVALMVIATATVVIPFIAYLCSSTSSYVNNLCPDRIFKREVHPKENNSAAKASEAPPPSVSSLARAASAPAIFPGLPRMDLAAKTPTSASARSQPPLSQAGLPLVKRVQAIARASVGHQHQPGIPQKEPSHKERVEERLRQAQQQGLPCSGPAGISLASGIGPQPSLWLFGKTQEILPGLLGQIQHPLRDHGEATVKVEDITDPMARNIALALEKELRENGYKSVQITQTFVKGAGGGLQESFPHYSFKIMVYQDKAHQITENLIKQVRESLDESGKATVRIDTLIKPVVEEVTRLLRERLAKEYHVTLITCTPVVGQRGEFEDSYYLNIEATRKNSAPAVRQPTLFEKAAISMAKKIEADWIKGIYSSTSERFVYNLDDRAASSIKEFLEAQLKEKYSTFEVSYSYDDAAYLYQGYGIEPGYFFEAVLTYTPGIFAKIAEHELLRVLPEARAQLEKRGEAIVELPTANAGLGKDLARLLETKLKAILPQFPSIHVKHDWSSEIEHGHPMNGCTPAKSHFTITAT